MPTVDTPRITATGTYPRITVNVVTGATGPGGGAVDSVNGQTGTVVLGASDVGALPDDTVIPDIAGLQATSEKNQPNGYAGLDGDGTIPDNRIPSSIARDTEIGTQITAHDGSGTAHATLFAGKVSTSAIDTDSTLAADSDTRVPSQKAVKAHVAAASVGAVISDQLLVSPAAVITFASIPGTYASLVIAYQCRGDASATIIEMRVRVNGDTGSNYNFQWVRTANATLASGATVATSTARLTYFPAANATSGYAGDGTFEIVNYAGSTFFKTVQIKSSREENGAAANMRNEWGHLTWKNTAPITQIELLPSGGNFIAGSRFTLYGISGG